MTGAERKRVLITGHTGIIGSAIRQSALGEKYELSYLSKDSVAGVRSSEADVGVMTENLVQALRGKDVVVHLAADKHEDGPWESILHNNIIGTCNVFEAARIAGVGRIIFASSVRATDMYQIGGVPKGFEGEWPALWKESGVRPDRLIGPEDPVRPYNFYGVSKVFGEGLGRYYSDRFNISVICFRIGAFQKDDKPSDDFASRLWISWRDGIQGFDRAIGAPETVRFGIFYLVSNNAQNVYDISDTKRVLGYEPQDDSDALPGIAQNHA